MNKLCLFLLLVFLLTFSMAATFPPADFDGKGIRNIYNFSQINATEFYGDGSGLTNVNTTNYTYNTWAYNQTIPANTYTDNVNTSQSSWITNTFETITNVLLKVSWTDLWGQVYNETEIDGLLDAKASLSYLDTNHYNKTNANLENASNNNYIVYANSTAGAYTNTQDILFNNSIADFTNNKFFSNIANFTGTLTDTKYCVYTTGTGIVCNSESGATDLTPYSTLSYLTTAHYNKTEIQNIINNGSYITIDTDTFVGNYSAFLNKIDWSHATNGTLALTSAIPTNTNQLLNGAGFYNSTDFSISDYAFLTTINNGTYTFDWNSTGLIKDWSSVDSFIGNYSTFLTHIDWSKVTNGTLALTTDLVDYNSSGLIIDWNSSGLIKDWTLDTSSFIDWATATNGTLALTSNIPTNNNQLINGLGFYNSTDFSILDYYTKTESDLENTSNNNYIVYTNGTMKDYVDTRGFGSGSITGAGTLNYIPMWNGTTSINNSVIYQLGTNVGIGTTSPRQKLDVNGNILFGTQTVMTSATTGGGFGANLIYDGAWKYINTGAASLLWSGGLGEMSVWTIPSGSGGAIASLAGAERMRISNSGGLSFGNAYVATDPGAGSMIISGNVGIGTTSPQNKLNVAGDGNFTGYVMSQGINLTALNSTGLIINWSSQVDLSGYVPYTGATGDVDLGSHGITVAAVKAQTSTDLIINGSTGTGNVVIIIG